MLYHVSKLEHYNILAEDGELGKVKDLYFDDHKWAVRYLVVDTRKWLPGKKVVVSPSGFDSVVPEEQAIYIRDKKEDIRNNASLEEKQAFSREKEMELTDFFGWKQYWAGDYLWGGYGSPLATMPEPGQKEMLAAKENNPPIEEGKYTGDDKLRSIEEIKGAVKHGIVHGKDGKAGYISDIIVDDETWKIRYLVVNTSEWSTNFQVLLSPAWLQSIDWVDNNFYIDLSLETIEAGPNYDKHQEITEELEEEIYRKYQKEPYWINK
ncbi:PRC-barrel domain-containing protein [Thalassobacillus pellis]|uniref:PRC-barrel domain-containing protein n=1 Tax=Thalassobacillus pellis TaxID=748008 RepID=UPI00196160D3|nr:PRC-barrel domain-containing protein [Thalassobacillus pellis]MBM7551188.1 sporulation protein YlmC with PRC-barrel domain [Thalassobacillus pellis]